MPPAPDKNNPLTTADDVIAFLRANPKFLEENPDAVEFLIPPRAASGKGIADFQSYMIKRLKDAKEEVISSARTIVENSRANMNNQQRIHEAVLRVLDARNFEDFIQIITSDLPTVLDVDIAVIVVDSDGASIPQVFAGGVRVVPKGTIGKWMEGKPVLLQDNINGIEAIYGGGALLVRSQILLRLMISAHAPDALLAFGSRNPGMFADGQATDQIQFLARVIERSFRRWLDLPA